jgi:transposase-like protein
MLEIDFKNKEALIAAFETSQKCIEHLEDLRWNGTVISPFDPTSKIYFCSKNNYKCRNSGKYFNVKTGTLLHNTKIDLQKWFLAIWIISLNDKKINSVALGLELGITQKTAWYMIKRIKIYIESKDNTFEKKINLSPTIKNKIAPKKEIAEIAEGNNKLPLLQWLQLLKTNQ